MRTTLTIDDDLLRRLKEDAHRRGVSFRDAVNDALRRALTSGLRRRRARFRVKVYPSVLQPGYDPAGFNKLADELEDAELARKLAVGR
jgi:hypothetical protein